MHKHTFALALMMLLSMNAAHAQAMRNGLPAVSTDGFVYEAGSQAEAIYGDECKKFGAEMVTNNPPPIDGFEKENRIDSGIFDMRAAGLTTGHGEYLPDAWGADEWTGNEWDQAAPQQTTVSGGNTNLASVNLPGVTGSINLNGMTVPDITGTINANGITGTVTGNGINGSMAVPANGPGF
ncbi:MAG TPA: hypothetical protein V6C81_22410 [Planktothrix sp.]|jgi:hypothetical protein